MRLTYGGGTANIAEAKQDIKDRKGKVLLKVVLTNDSKLRYGFFLQNKDGAVFDICSRQRIIKTLSSAGPVYEFMRQLDPDLIDFHFPFLRVENAINFGHKFEPYSEPNRVPKRNNVVE